MTHAQLDHVTPQPDTPSVVEVPDQSDKLVPPPVDPEPAVRPQLPTTQPLKRKPPRGWAVDIGLGLFNKERK